MTVTTMMETTSGRKSYLLLAVLAWIPVVLSGVVLEEDRMFWERMVLLADSLATPPPTLAPAPKATDSPTKRPTSQATIKPTPRPTDPAIQVTPTSSPTKLPTVKPSTQAPSTSRPTQAPTRLPTVPPTALPTSVPLIPTETPLQPTMPPTPAPTSAPILRPTPTSIPTLLPTIGTEAPSSSPTKRPTVVPTAGPTQILTRPPTEFPSQEPSVSQTQLVVEQPSAEPTNRTPSQTPTESPTEEQPLSPTLTPFSPPTELPSSMPTVMPSYTPSASPTEQPVTPTLTPSSIPSGLPSAMPTVTCVLEVNTTCTVKSEGFSGRSCANLNIPFPSCMDRPMMARMKYVGGNCREAFSWEGYYCVDTEFGPPPVQQGELSYIVVTDAKQGTIFHRDWVEVGQEYEIRGNVDFGEYQRILVFRSNETGNPENLLQVVQYPSSCAPQARIALKHQFGASILTGFQNALQGDVSCLVNVTFSVDIMVADNFPGISANLTRFNFLSNFGGLQDFITLIDNTTLSPNQKVTVDLPDYVFDLTQRLRYTSLVQTSATSSPSGITCDGSFFDSFVAGNPVEPPLPTEPPTFAPSVSLAPTVDNMNMACEIDTEIICESLVPEGFVIGLCDDFQDPSRVVCSDNFPATRLVFKYIGIDTGSGIANEVFIQMENSVTSFFFSTTIVRGGIFEIRGNLGSSVDVSISDILPGNIPGMLFDSFPVKTDCSVNDPVLNLTTVFGGALELISFENAAGFFSSQARVRLTYNVVNAGMFKMITDSIVVVSDFQPDPFEDFDDGVILSSQQQLMAFREISSIDLGAKFRAGTQFQFSMTGEGRSLRNNITCSSDSQYVF